MRQNIQKHKVARDYNKDFSVRGEVFHVSDNIQSEYTSHF